MTLIHLAIYYKDMKKTKFELFLDKALDQLFKSVGFKQYDSKFTQQDDWYTKRTWTSDQEKLYKQWFIQTIKKDMKMNTFEAERSYSLFNLNWGWKSEDKH